MSNKKIFYILGGAIVVLLVVFLIKGKNVKETEVVAEKAARVNITEYVSASGKLYPEVEVKISPDVSGEITEMFVKDGDTVKKGDLLLKINPELYLTALDQARASLNNARANMATSEAQLSSAKATFSQQQKSFERSKKLFADKVLSQQDFDNAEAAFLNAKASLESAEKNVMAAGYTVASFQARLDESMKNFGRTSIYAPMDGIVASLNKKKGERVVGTNMMDGTQIMMIADLNRMEVRVDVNESDIVRIKIGDTAIVEVEAYQGKKFKGVVREVANSAEESSIVSTNKVTNFVVKVSILPDSYAFLLEQNPGRPPFRNGMTASVEIITAKEINVISVPVAAVTTRQKEDNNPYSGKTATKSKIKKDPSKGEVQTLNEDNNNELSLDEVEIIVFVVKDGKAVKRKVETGIQDSKNIKITEGIDEGEMVVTWPYSTISSKLKDGDKVKLVKKEALFESKK